VWRNTHFAWKNSPQFHQTQIGKIFSIAMQRDWAFGEGKTRIYALGRFCILKSQNQPKRRLKSKVKSEKKIE